MPKTALFSRLNLIFSVLLIMTLVFSVIVLGLDAHLIDQFNASTGRLSFTLFTTIFSLITLVPLLVLAHMRPAMMILQSRFVLGLLFVLMIFWLAAAAADTDGLTGFLDLCGNSRFSYFFLSSESGSFCSVTKALLAFCWLAWISITVVFGGLLTYILIEHFKGHRDVWSTSPYGYPFGSTEHKTTGAGVSSKEEAQPQMTSVNTAVNEEPHPAPTTAA